MSDHAIPPAGLLAGIRAQAFRKPAPARFGVFNPADGSHLADVPDQGVAEMLAAIASAKDALASWSARTARERGRVLRRWSEVVMDRQTELAGLLTLEQGKPLAEATGEIAAGANFIDWFAEEGRRVYGDTIPTHSPDKRLLVLKQPVGVVGAITPWNFPSAMIARKVAPALAAGCTVVVKPAAETPLSALALALLAEEAGIPQGVLNVVTTRQTAEVAEALTGSTDVRKISFTGSTRVGKILMRQSAATMKNCRSSWAATRPSWCSTTPTWTRRWLQPSPPSSAMPARPASVPTAFWCNRRCRKTSSHVTAPRPVRWWSETA